MEAPALLLDAMLGKLARWLRLLGYDAAYSQEDDALLAHRARAEGRILITRDHGLARRRGLRLILLESQDLQAQLREVWPQLPPLPPDTPPRCMVCNVPLHPLAHHDAVPFVPPYIAAHHRHFEQCPQCGRVYWQGTHWKRIDHRLQSLQEGGEPFWRR